MTGETDLNQHLERIIWRCENCNTRLATVINGWAELKARVVLKPESVSVCCPTCGHLNPWYFTRPEPEITLDKANKLA